MTTFDAALQPARSDATTLEPALAKYHRLLAQHTLAEIKNQK